MKYNQTTKVLCEDNKIREFKEGYIGAYYLVAYEEICDDLDKFLS